MADLTVAPLVGILRPKTSTLHYQKSLLVGYSAIDLRLLRQHKELAGRLHVVLRGKPTSQA